MATWRYIYIPTKKVNEPKDHQHYRTFDACKYAREAFKLERMAGKVKEFINAHAIETIEHGENYNGYGYEDHFYGYLLSAKDAQTLSEIIEGKKVEKKEVKETGKVGAWCKRLAKLTGISMEAAQAIAEEKLEYQRHQIRLLETRQSELRYSVKREKLLKKIMRENPLRRITDESHAQAILAASHRHNDTPYEHNLEALREKAEWGLIDHEDVRGMARQASYEGKWIDGSKI